MIIIICLACLFAVVAGSISSQSHPNLVASQTVKADSPSKKIIYKRKERITFSVGNWLSTHPNLNAPLNTHAFTHEKIEALNFNTKRLTGPILNKTMSGFQNFNDLSALFFERVKFKEDRELFQGLVENICEKKYHQWLYVKKEFLSDEQWSTLSQLCNSNDLKGLQVHAIDFPPDGVVRGYFHMNQTRYNEIKILIAEQQVRWTLRQALQRYFQDRPVETVFDFGAGFSPELLFLAKNDKQMQKIVAADFDAGQLKKLKKFLHPPYNKRLETFGGAFINYEVKSKFDLFISSFTFPYRTPDQFAAVWHKAVSMTKAGGVMAFHLFGSPQNPHPDLTYHTREQIKQLLESICIEFEILTEYPKGDFEFGYWCAGGEVQFKLPPVTFTPGDFKRTDIYGGDEPEWGTLFHIVARLKD